MQNTAVSRMPRRASRSSRKDAQFPAEVLAANVRALRLLRRLTQDDVAEQMQRMGHATWSRATVSEIERYGRSLTFDEIVSLAVVFRVPPLEIQDPLGPALLTSVFDFGGPEGVPPGVAMRWIRGQIAIGITDDGEGIWWEATGDGDARAVRKEVEEVFAEHGWVPRSRKGEWKPATAE